MREIVSDRLSRIEDKKVAAFLYNSNAGQLKIFKKAEINDLLKMFNCGEGDILSTLLGETNLQPYFDAITNLHKVSHDDGASMTLDYFQKVLPCAEAILEAFYQELHRD